LKPGLRSLFEELAQAVQDIEKHGCSFKGLNWDWWIFLPNSATSVVELCWQYGEKKSSSYHRAHRGFAGRYAAQTASHVSHISVSS